MSFLGGGGGGSRGDQMELWEWLKISKAELSENLRRRSLDLEDPRYSTTVKSGSGAPPQVITGIGSGGDEIL